MQGFYKSFSFMLAFMVLINIFNMLLGEKFTEMFLLLILLGMAVMNVDKFSTVFKGLGG